MPTRQPRDFPKKRPERLKGAPLEYAPENELGVVFLFASVAKKLGLRIEQIRPQFPDCIAYQKTGDGEKRIRIEFEFRSRNFKTQGHSTRGCDWIVCWEDNWADAPRHLHIEELRRHFGLGFNVWIVAVAEPFKATISGSDSFDSWSAPRAAHKRDLILFYKTRPEQFIEDIFVLSGPVKYVTAGWKPGKDYMGPIRRVCHLNDPIYWEGLQGHRVLGRAGFVRGSMRGRCRLTAEHWRHLYDMIIAHNPSVKRALAKCGPERMR